MANVGSHWGSNKYMIVEYFLEWVETAPVTRRIEAAGALVRAWLSDGLSEEEQEKVEAAITVLLEDPAPGIRLALAEGFGAYDTAPRHVMCALARDNIDISVIVLSHSPVFHDAELVEFARNGLAEQQIAVACRPWMSAPVMDAICQFACKDASLALLMNPAAFLAGEHLQHMAERHGTDKIIRTILLERPDLPPEVRLVLINKLGEALQSFVSERSWLPEVRAQQTIREACDKASITFAAHAPDEDVERVVQGLIDTGQLTTSYLLRAVCMGNITLAAKAFSRLSGVKFERVESILTRDRESAFRAVYDRAGLPESAFFVFNCAISTWRRLLSSKSPINQSRMPFLVTREVLQSYSGKQDAVLDELLVLLRKLAAETARESARQKAVEMTTANSRLLSGTDMQREPELTPDDMALFAENLRIELEKAGPELLGDPDAETIEEISADSIGLLEEPELDHETPEVFIDGKKVANDSFTLSQSVLHASIQDAA